MNTYCIMIKILSYINLFLFTLSNIMETKNSNMTLLDYYDENGNLLHIDLTIPREVVLAPESRRTLSKPAEIRFYTRESRDEPKFLYTTKISKTNATRLASLFNPSKPTKFITHGWMSNGNSDSTKLIKNAYLDKFEVNVFVVDWEEGANFFDYIRSARAVVDVANQVSQFVADLVIKFNVKGKNLHFIGHSLGAHVMALAANKLKKRNIRVGRITGLDPARPYFEFPQFLTGIQKDDADFVDIIHTNSGIFGISQNVGHVDFYPNDGGWQYECCQIILSPICAHACCYYYFERSLRGAKYEGSKCDSYYSYSYGKCKGNQKNVIGEKTKTSVEGIFYLTV